MKLLLLLIAALCTAPLSAQITQSGDTTWVQTFTFDDITKRSGTFEFPDGTESYERVLMYYTLKCDSRTTQDDFPCGEWDYLTYTYLTDSTGRFDSTRFSQANYVVNGFSPDEFPYTSTPQFETVQESCEVATVTELTTERAFPIGMASSTVNVGENARSGRALFMWTSSDFADAGLQSGKALTNLSLSVAEAVSLSNLRIGISFTEMEEIHPRNEYAGTTVFNCPINLVQGDNNIVFTDALEWEEGQNVVVSISYESDIDPVTLTLNARERNNGFIDMQQNTSLLFDGLDYVEVPVAPFAELDKEITVSFWLYGTPSAQPKNQLVFEGRNAANQRVIGSHLPWGDGTVYWDAGNEGSGYDRISKAASEQEYEGEWTHWALTKNANTGTMQIFRNGELWHSGTGLTRSMAGIERFRIGANANSTPQNPYAGMIDEFRVWNKALTPQEIEEYANNSVQITDVAYGNLLVNFSFDEGTGSTVHDSGPHGVTATLMGTPAWRISRSASERFYQSETMMLPFVTWFQNDQTVDITTETHTRTLQVAPVSVVMYENNGPGVIIPEDYTPHPGAATDTLFVWPAERFYYTYDENGVAIDSTFVDAETTLVRENQTWYSSIVQYEIGRFITPYGIGLDLGPQGFTWVYEVSDYQALLQNWVHLSSGNQQELQDLRFAFIKGTAPRDVVTITKLWDGTNFKQPQIIDGSQMTEMSVGVHQDAKAIRIDTRSTGHRFDNPTNCAEFCERTHFLTVDGNRMFDWIPWDECGDNPVFPQGGTWLIDRAGWCPGAPVHTYHWELSDVTPGNTLTIDYGMDQGAAQDDWGDLVIRSHVIQYGAPNHQLDARIADIISPSATDIHTRKNPICANPVIMIENTGAETLTSLIIEYGLEGNTQQYTWEGSLAFLETEIVELPANMFTESEDTQTFTVTISAPNGGTDEYANNNEMSSQFTPPPLHLNSWSYQLRTNALTSYVWSLKDADGNVIMTNPTPVQANTEYSEDFDLEDGCYVFELEALEGYGLDAWWVRDQIGTGSLNMFSEGKNIATFEPDFGNKIVYWFRTGQKPQAQVSRDTIDFGQGLAVGVTYTDSATITPVNEKGLFINAVTVSSIFKDFELVSTTPEIPTEGLQLQQGETLTAVVSHTPKKNGQAVSQLRFNTNDELEPIHSVNLRGLTGETDVPSEVSRHMTFGVSPNPASDVLQLLVSSEVQAHITVKILTLQGATVLTESLQLGTDVSKEISVQRLATGMYMLVLETPWGTATEKVSIVR